MAYLVSRQRERTLMRKHHEPHSSPWTEWETCEGTQGLTPLECQQLIMEWSIGDRLEWLNTERTHAMVTDPYGKTEYIVAMDNPS